MIRQTVPGGGHQSGQGIDVLTLDQGKGLTALNGDRAQAILHHGDSASVSNRVDSVLKISVTHISHLGRCLVGQREGEGAEAVAGAEGEIGSLIRLRGVKIGPAVRGLMLDIDGLAGKVVGQG